MIVDGVIERVDEVESLRAVCAIRAAAAASAGIITNLDYYHQDMLWCGWRRTVGGRSARCATPRVRTR